MTTDLKSLRELWKQREEYELAHRPQWKLVQETEPLFRPEREAYIIEMKKRLQKLADWQKKQNGKS